MNLNTQAPTQSKTRILFDPLLLLISALLLGIGLVMVASSSVPIAEAKKIFPLYFAINQVIYMAIGLVCAWVVTFIPMRFWYQVSWYLLLLSIASLAFILIPGVAKPVNGSLRWLQLGPVSLQMSEFTKIAVIIYISSYLVRHAYEVSFKITGFLKPLLVIGIIASLLLKEPDLGATVVIISTVIFMLFISNVPWYYFFSLLLSALAGIAILSVSSPYRLERLVSFLNPWNDQFSGGYQLTQALIAFGRGSLLGTGLGGSVQKLLYLPEPHTDFLFAVFAEELGLVGSVLIIFLFSAFVYKIFKIAWAAWKKQQYFSANVVFGIGFCFAVQSLINIGVNLGLLPTKGLTLPFMSYGGSSMLATLIGLALVFRVDFELKR
ncbi:MAG: putative lipid II flippase FtsW [Gammaproteobacteria bacterium]